MEKKDLQQYRALVLEARQLALRLDEMRALVSGPRSPVLTGAPKAPGSGDAVARAIAGLVDLEQTYIGCLAELYRETAAIEACIAALPPMERALLRARYIEARSWDGVADELGYSVMQTHRIHGRALAMLKEGGHNGKDLA